MYDVSLVRARYRWRGHIEEVVKIFRINREVKKKNTHRCRIISVTRYLYTCRVFSNDITVAMLVSQTSPVSVELFSYINVSFVPVNLN